MPFDAQRLYELLPAIVRIRDAEQGEPLKALAELIASEVAVLEEDLEQLYDDQFIETCADWVVPYIGDLIGWEPLHPVSPKVASARAEVANTITYRRRKGTAAVLEQLARDVTGWPARVVEYFELLATTQYLNHPRPHNRVTPDLRNTDELLRLDGAFDVIPHTLDVRRIGQGGRWNIPNIGVHLWRISAYPATGWPAAAVDQRRYRVSPLGQDIPLYTRPETEDTITHLAEPINVPEPLCRRLFDADLARYYGRGKSLRLWVDGAPIPSEQIQICDLADIGSHWANAPAGERYTIDPERGRIYLPDTDGAQERQVTTDFHYGAAVSAGGGEYDREASFLAETESPIELGAGHALGDALESLNAAAGGGVIEIADNGVFTDAGGVGFGVNQEAVGELRSANGRRAIVSGGLRVAGENGAVAILNGLLIKDGPVEVPPVGSSDLQRLILRHCTLVPGLALEPDGFPRNPVLPSLVIQQAGVDVVIEDCILGGIRAVEGARVTLRNCFVDATDPTRIAFCGAVPEGAEATESVPAGAALTLENCTVVGRLYTERLDLASNTLFIASRRVPSDETPVLSAEQKQAGCVRFSYLPSGPLRLPKTYRCQPRTAVDAALAQAQRDDPSISSERLEEIARAAEAAVRPRFVSLVYGHPGYGMLRSDTDAQLLTGADNGSEIGALNRLFHTQRLTNLHVRFREYLRYGLEAGVLCENE